MCVGVCVHAINMHTECRGQVVAVEVFFFYNHVGPGVFRILGSLISPLEQLWGVGSATLAQFRQNSVGQLCKKTHQKKGSERKFPDVLMVLLPQRGLPFDLLIKGISAITCNVIPSSLQRTSALEEL